MDKLKRSEATAKKNPQKIIYSSTRKQRHAKKETDPLIKKIMLISGGLIGGLVIILMIWLLWNPANKEHSATKNSVETQVKIAQSSSPTESKNQPEKAAKMITKTEVTESTEGKEMIVSESENKESYTVGAGDTLSNIAEKTGVSLSDLRAFNHLKSDAVVAGQQLKLLQAKDSEDAAKLLDKNYTVEPGDNLTKIAERAGLTVDDLYFVNNLSNAEVHPGQQLLLEKYNGEVKSQVSTTENNTPTNSYYTVQKGDNLYRIAMKYGTTVEDIQRLNKISEYEIQTGRRLQIK